MSNLQSKQEKKLERKSGVQRVVVDQQHQNRRLDNFLTTQLKVPKSRIYQMIRKGEVRIDSSRAKPSTRLSKGQSIRIPPSFNHFASVPELKADILQMLDQQIVFENEHMILFNKPSGLAVHAGSGL